jgi:alpha-tubulin suppressor-like RCC1 family protein
MLAAPPPISRRVATAFDVSFAVDVGASSAAAAEQQQHSSDDRPSRQVQLDGALSRSAREGTSRHGVTLATPRAAQPDLPSVESARVLAHSLEETARAHRALYRDLEDVETVAAAVTTLVREQGRALSLAPTLHPLVRVLELLKRAVHGLSAHQPADFARFRPEEYLATVIRASDLLVGLLKRLRRELKIAERAAAAERSGIPDVSSTRRRGASLCEVILGNDQLASQFWSIAFGGDKFEVKRSSFASCCGRVIEQEWLDIQLVERSLDRYDRGLISQLDLSEFVDKHGGMVRGFAAVCLAGQVSPFAWGGNRKGECGLSGVSGDSCVDPVQVNWQLDGARIRQVDCDAGISAAVLDNGELYTWGSVTGGKLGRDEPFGPGADELTPGVDGVPRKVEALDGCRIAAVACGASYVAAVTEDGQLFTWGSFGGGDHAPTLGHRHGEVLLGTEDGTHYSPVPIAVRALRSMHVTQVSCGPEHAAAVTAHGQLYCWGSGDRGRLGIGSEVDAWAPQQVADLAGKRVVQVACGTVHTLALTIRGELFVWGGARSGKLGLGGVGFCDTFVQKTRSGQPFVPRPKSVSALAAMHVTHVAAGRAHSLAVTEQGALYTWGCGKDGKLGHGGLQAEWLPRRVSSMLTVAVIQASCGREHTAAVTSAGWLFSWGRGARGKLGVGSEEDIDRPARVTRVPGPAHQVSCGRHHTLAVVGRKAVSNEAVALYERQLQTVLLQAATESAEHAHRGGVGHVETVRSDRAPISGRSQFPLARSDTRNSRHRLSDEDEPQLPSDRAISGGPHTQMGNGRQPATSSGLQQPAALGPEYDAEDLELEQDGQEAQDAWKEKFEQEREKFEREHEKAQQVHEQNSLLQQQLDQLRAGQGTTPLGPSRAIRVPVPDLNATVDEFKQAQSEEVAGMKEITLGEQKKVAAAVAYARVYQDLEALKQTRPSDVEPLLQDVAERIVKLRGELDETQLQNALEKEQLLPEGDWSPEQSVRSASVDHASARKMSQGPSAREQLDGRSVASSPVAPTDQASQSAPSSVDPVERSIQLLIEVKQYDEPEQKLEPLVEGIAMLERALRSGHVKTAAMPELKKKLAAANKKKVELEAQVENKKQQAQ